MSSTVTYVIAIALSVISVILSYFYLSYRKKNDEKGLKAFFRFEKSKRKLLAAAALLCVSVFVFVFGVKASEISFIKAIMNSQVIIWTSLLAYIDFKEKIIPNQLILVGLIFWAILVIIYITVDKTSIKQLALFSLGGGFVCGGILLLVSFLVRSALGMGDVKMIFVIGLLYGIIDTYSIVFASVLIMAIVSVILLILKKATRKTAIPMAPFIAVGLFINILMGI